MKSLPRLAVAGLVAGATLVSTAWAGVGLAPVRTVTSSSSEDPAPAIDDVTGDDVHLVDGPSGPVDDWAGARVGASKLSMYPRPEDYDGYWERDASKCERMNESVITELVANTEGHIDHLATAGSPWPENPNCIYVGGFGLGPENPAVEFDQEYGLWVRSIAIGDGADTLVLTIIDAEGYLWDYASKCTDCGLKQIGESLAEELDIPASSFVIAATHSHSAPEFLGGWGFVPDWYMKQIGDTIKNSIRQAVADMVPATLEVGEEMARTDNSERRDTYRSAEEQQVGWLRATDVETGEVIATVGAFAGHPVTRGDGGGVATSDWVGVFEKRLEDRFGGIGLHFMTGLGNMSARGGMFMGNTLADRIPEPGGGTVLTNTDVRVAQHRWLQPATNVPLTGLGLPGFFDRKFVAGPSTLTTGKSPETAPCTSASAATVELPVTAARIGDLFALSAAPGEVFSNLTNTVKEQSGAKFTMPLAQANDALGYMPQSFEHNVVGQQGPGFVAGGVLVVNYEDAYSIDRCVGDMVLETTLDLLEQI